MDKAEMALPIPANAANDPSTNASMTVAELRGRLDEIMKPKA